MTIDPNQFNNELSDVELAIHNKSAGKVLARLITLLLEKQLMTEDELHTLLAD